MTEARAPQPQAETSQVDALLHRSHELGADPTVTNYGGGNTSCKLTADSPATGKPVELLVVKGSGGDLGSLAPEGLAWLELERVRTLQNVYRGPEHEDEMVALWDHCRFGQGGAAPSIDTAMHAFVEAPHVDHLHPEDMLAEVTSAAGLERDAESTVVVRCIMESMAAGTNQVVDQLGGVTEMHVFGGGARAALYRRLLGQRSGLPVRTGPVEATALGNALVQGIALGVFRDLAEARSSLPAGPEPSSGEETTA